MAAVAVGKAIESEVSPLLNHPTFGLNANLFQETRVGGAERPYATGNFYIAISATPKAGVADLQEYMAAAFEASKGYAVTGPIVNFRINANHLMAQNEELEATANELLGRGKSSLVMVAPPAPPLSSSGFPKFDQLDRVNTDGHPGEVAQS